MSHPIENIMQTSMEQVKSLADVNTVIGEPIMTGDETMILPVSKVSLGMIVGGGEYVALPEGKKASIEIDENAAYPFIGASTVGMCLTPLAFLAVQAGTVRVLPAKQDCPYDRLIDLAPQIIDTVERLMKNGGCHDKEENRHLKECGCGKEENKVKSAAMRAESAAGNAGRLADKAERAADKARSAAEIAYDTAIEASKAAASAEEKAKSSAPSGKAKGGV